MNVLHTVQPENKLDVDGVSVLIEVGVAGFSRDKIK